MLKRKFTYLEGRSTVRDGLGFLISFVLIGSAMAFGNGGFLRFVDIPSFLIVFGGTIGATFVTYTPQEVSETWHKIRETWSQQAKDLSVNLRYLVHLAHAVRAEGRVTALEREADRTSDPFVRLALEVAVDGQDKESIRHILQTEINVSKERGEKAIAILETMGNYAPALGLIGTVIGLIQTLSFLGNSKAIGPAMATAFITTFYGCVLSNLIFVPLAGKLRKFLHEEILTKTMMLEGILGVANEENPMLVEQRLRSFHTAERGR